MKSCLIGFFILGFQLFQAQLLWGAELSAFCDKSSQSTDTNGQNIEAFLPMGSVTKVMTSFWALNRLGPRHRYKTQFDFLLRKDGSVDVHILGGLDPLTGREFFQFLVAELNRHGIYQINTLSFDENFKFYEFVRSPIVAQNPDLNLLDPNPERVTLELKNTVENLSENWERLRKKAAFKYKQLLTEKIELEVKDIQFIATSQYQRKLRAKRLTYLSAPVLDYLKEMNRNSNNHAANLIFHSLGGVSEFYKWLWKNHRLTQKDILVINGSGLPWFINGVKTYNMSTCAATLKLIESLNVFLINQKMKIEEVLSVAGTKAIDPGGGEPEENTLRFYANALTDLSLIAKTGSIGPAVSLAGIISTANGFHYFSIVAGLSDFSEAPIGKRLIFEKLVDLYTGVQSQRITYEPLVFLPFDRESELH